MENGGFDLVRMFQEAGAFAYISVAASVVIMIVIFALPKLPEPSVWAMALLPFALGYVGYMLGMRMVEQAIVYADPESRAVLLEAGTREARQNLVIGGGLTVICAVTALLTKAKRSS